MNLLMSQKGKKTVFDARKIIPGLVIFFILITVPLWYSLAGGAKAEPPEPEIITPREQCVESAQYMRESHMELLDEWRESVVRGGVRTYLASDGQEYRMSLTGTCMDCHSNKAQFCDSCHDYAGVEPDCWSGHISPELEQ